MTPNYPRWPPDDPWRIPGWPPDDPRMTPGWPPDDSRMIPGWSQDGQKKLLKSWKIIKKFVENCHFCHSISFFYIKYRRATAPSFSPQCLLDGSSNLARGYIFWKSFENPSGTPWMVKKVNKKVFTKYTIGCCLLLIAVYYWLLSTIGCCLLLVAVYYWLLFPGKCFFWNAWSVCLFG